MLLVRAVNTALDSENKIHDDAVAASYGFRGGLVPGVTVYGYLAAAACQHFGSAWLERGAMDVRFHQPVYDGEQVSVTLSPQADGRVIVQTSDRASASAWMHQEQPPATPDSIVALERKLPSIATLAPGTVLGSIALRLDLASSPFSAPLAPELDGRAHPAILLALANRIFVENYQLGPWIHVASEVRKFGSAKNGDELRVRARVEDRWERKGHEFVALAVSLSNRGQIIETVRHTAIWHPRPSR